MATTHQKTGPKKRRAPARGRRGASRKRPGRAPKARGGLDGPLGDLRRQAQAVIQRLQRVGWQRIGAIEKQIEALNRQRQALMNELSAVVRGVGGAGRGAKGARRGRRARVDWNEVYGNLPRGSFKASDVRKIVPGVAPGTLSQRLTAWVKARKLRRSGSRRGTRYTRP